MVDDPNPEVWLRQVGVELRRFRLAAKKSLQQAGAHIGCSHSKISKIENAHLGIKTEELRQLLDFYVVDRDTADSLIRVNEQPAGAEWWSPYRDAVPDWFRRYVSLEAAASTIRVYQPDSVPGLLQTENYARAVLRAWEPDAGDQVIRGPLELRMMRQSVLAREDPLHLTVVIGEATLRKVVGDTNLMHEQLLHLMEASELPNMDLHVLPFVGSTHPMVASAFFLLNFPDQDDSVVYLEDLIGATYVDKPAEHVGRYNVVFNRLRRASLDPSDSRKLIATIKEDYA